MKVVLVNHSDTRGGASVVTFRLMQALRQQGVDARMLVMHKATDDDNVAVAGSLIQRKAAFLYEHADIYLHNGFNRSDLFKASIAVCGLPLHRHPWVKEADAVVLNWVNQGMLSLHEISLIDKPLVWTMHDMWCITGVCHHAGECIAYKQQCGRCRLMGGHKDNDLSRTTYLRKLDLYTRKPIQFVAVSRWLERKCRESSLLRHLPLRTIPNAFPVEKFHIQPRMTREQLSLPPRQKLIVMGAARLDDPIKGLDIAVEALNQIAGGNVAAVFFGEIRDPHALDSLRMPHVALGTISDPETIKEIYAHACCVLSTSHYETLPGTLVEGMAAGCVPVTFDRGGQTDIVDHRRTGYIARYPHPEDVAEGIRFALRGDIDPETLRRAVTDKFSARAVAQRYISLLREITNQPD